MSPQPFNLSYVNNSLICIVFPRPKFPNGLTLTYSSCPETYDNQTSNIIRYCCLNILFTSIQDSMYKKTQDWLRYNSSTMLIVPAIFFNILSLAVLVRFQRAKSIVKTSTTFYMINLSIFDTLTMISKFLWVKHNKKAPVLYNFSVYNFMVYNFTLCNFMVYNLALYIFRFIILSVYIMPFINVAFYNFLFIIKRFIIFGL
jgi:hypothetical protein